MTDREELSWERFSGAACELAAGITGVECEYVWRRTERWIDCRWPRPLRLPRLLP